MRKRYVAIILVAVAASLSIGYIYLTGDTQGYPRKLGSMTLTQFTSGTSALSELSIMHFVSPEVKMVDAFIVEYAGRGTPPPSSTSPSPRTRNRPRSSSTS